MATIDIVFTWTVDELKLQGVHYPSNTKDICAILIHGMSGNFIDNYFGHVLGDTLQQQHIGFIFAHNRGHSHMNDLEWHRSHIPGTYEYQRCGAMYERFNDSINDIDAWLTRARELGYKRFILVGHSLGGPKVIYYLNQKPSPDIAGVVLASPADMVGLAKRELNYESLLLEARQNVADGNQEALLSSKIWDEYQLSSQTFLDLFEENGPCDVLPVLRNPAIFPELTSITAPILCILGEYDDVVIRSLSEDMELLKQKATSAASFSTNILPGANHTYNGVEIEFSETFINWIKCKV